MKYLYWFNILLLKKGGGKVELSSFNCAAACVITADDFMPFMLTDTEQSNWGSITNRRALPWGRLQTSPALCILKSPLVLCLGLRLPTATLTCLPFSSLLGSYLGSRVDETATVHRCSFRHDQETHSHNNLPVLLQPFWPPLPKRLLSLRWGGCAVNISVRTYPVPMVSIDVQVTSYQWSTWVDNIFRNTRIHTTHKQQVRKKGPWIWKRPWRGKGEKGKRKLDFNPEA